MQTLIIIVNSPNYSTKDKQQSETPFIPLVEEITRGILNGTLLTPNGNKYAKESASGYSFLIRWLFKYEMYHKGEIYLEDIDKYWVEKFSDFLLYKKLAESTVMYIRSIIKAVLNRLHKRGLSTYNGSDIWAKTKGIDRCYNTLDELRYIARLDLSYRSFKKWQKVRDIYIVQSFLGLKFNVLKKVLLNLNEYLKTDNDKTYFEIKTKSRKAKTLIIPMPRVVREILDKYNGDLKIDFSIRHYNKTIKYLAMLAGINKKMTSYTACENFISNAFNSGIPETCIKRMTNCSTFLASLKIYQCQYLSTRYASVRIADHPLFNISFQKETEPLQKPGDLPPVKQEVIAAA